ncbi:MAG: hypothetical protein ILP18_07525 [Treponema sp.]|nr:hypothetical protein [Treponema sp.]
MALGLGAGGAKACSRREACRSIRSADFSRASPYGFTHVALTLPLTAGSLQP